MKVLVTGATGFIGSALIHCLAEKSAYRAVAAFRSLPIEFPNTVKAVKIGDIGTKIDFSSILKDVDIVVHTAARVHIMRGSGSAELEEFRHINVHGTLNLARQAAAAGVRRFIFLSTVKANGEETQQGQPFSELSCPNPQDPYGISKHDAETELRVLAKKTDLEVVIIRPPLVYGPGAKGNFRSLIDWVRKGFPLPLGNIHNKRSLIALDNLIDFIITCIAHPAAANETFLVADGKDLSTTELMQHLGRAMKKNIHLIPVPMGVLKFGALLLGKSPVAQRICGNLQVDIRKARKLLGWAPPVSVEEGFRRAVRVN